MAGQLLMSISRVIFAVAYKGENNGKMLVRIGPDES